MTLYVHIDRIVLDGVDPGPGQLARLQAAIEQELGRLLAADAGAAPRAGGATRAVAGGTLDLGGAPAAPELGRRIAQATYEGIRRDAAPTQPRGTP